MTEAKTELLPLGSIVTIEGTERKLMIVGRGLAVDLEGNGPELYDYAMVVYPFGIIGDALVYTNHDKIVDVVFEGYADEENAEMLASITEAMKTLDIPKADPEGAAHAVPDPKDEGVW